MIRNILYPTDLGLYGTYILHQVLELAEQYQAKVTVLHVVEPLGVFAEAVLDTYVPEEMIDELRNYGMPAVMEAIRQQVVEAFEAETADLKTSCDPIEDVIVSRGAVADLIMETVQQKEIDLVVMGSRGGEEQALTGLGSHVNKILQRSEVPVMVIPLKHTQRRAKMLANLPPQSSPQ